MAPRSGELSGRVAIVTGAGAGIGAGIALALSEAGAAVAVADLDETTAASTARALENKGGQALAVGVDVSDAGQVQDMRRQFFVNGRWLDVWMAEIHREDWLRAREATCSAP